MVTVNEIYEYIDELAPFNTQMEFDNSGILVEGKNKNVKKVLLSLDITFKVVEEAIENKCDLIISHHPIIYKPLSKLLYNNPVYLLAQSGITAICAHTNLDLAKDIGVNASLTKLLKLQNIKPLSFYNDIPFALYGDLDEYISENDFCNYVKKALNCTKVRYIKGKNKIKTVGVCGGSGGKLIYDAIATGIDAFITGEINYHEILDSKANGLAIVDTGHFASENIVIEPLLNVLSKKFSNVKFIKSSVHKDAIISI